MALEEITREGITLAIDEFERIGRDAMLNKYRGGRARTWYVYGKYDLKLTCRAAHEHQGLGPLPPGPGTFKTYDARDHLNELGIPVGYVQQESPP